MTFIRSCGRNHVVPHFVSLKVFSARVFTFLCAIAVNIVKLGTLLSKIRARARSAEAEFKSTFVTSCTEKSSMALYPSGILY